MTGKTTRAMKENGRTRITIRAVLSALATFR